MNRINKIDKCSFCGLKNKDLLLLRSDCWISKIQIRYISNDALLDELSVCPKCRIKHTIQELYMTKMNAGDLK